MRNLKSKVLKYVILVLLGLVLLSACSDKNKGPEYSFNRAIQQLLVLKECADTTATTDCYLLEWGMPYDTVNLERFHIWIDTTYVKYNTEEPSSNALNNSITVDFDASDKKLFDTLDISQQIAALKDRDEVLISIWPEFCQTISLVV